MFLIEKYNEDLRQDEKHVPDLLESIMRPTDPVKYELRQKLFKIDQFGSKITKNEGFKVLDSGNPKFSRRRPTQPSRLVGFKQEMAIQTRINPKNAGFKRLQSLFTLVHYCVASLRMRSEIGGSGSEKKLCTLPRSKP